MTLKEIYKDATQKNRRFFAICFAFTFFGIAVTWNSPIKKTVRGNVQAYTVLVCCLVVSIVVMICLIKDSRDFKIYQLMYDFKVIEQQMAEKETISIPERHFYITREYIISVNGNLKILKRNSILEIKETKIPIRNSKNCYYRFIAYQMQGKSVAFLQILAPKNEMEAEELMRVRGILKNAFPGKTGL